jgi:hypothetical protein
MAAIVLSKAPASSVVARSQVAVEQRGAEARHQQVAAAVAVVVEPQRVGDDGVGGVAAGDAGRRGDVLEGQLAALAGEVAQQVLRPSLAGIGEEEVVPAVAVEVAHRDRGAAVGEHLQHLGVGALAEVAGRVGETGASRRADFLEAQDGGRRGGRGRLAGGDHRRACSGGGEQHGEDRRPPPARPSPPHRASHSSARLVSTRWPRA